MVLILSPWIKDVYIQKQLLNGVFLCSAVTFLVNRSIVLFFRLKHVNSFQSGKLLFLNNEKLVLWIIFLYEISHTQKLFPRAKITTINNVDRFQPASMKRSLNMSNSVIRRENITYFQNVILKQ